MKILMYGPPKGHNIKLYLDFFEKYSDEFQLTYVFTGKQRYSFQDFQTIEFIDYKKEWPKFINLLFFRLKTFDLIWTHNWVKFYVVLLNIWFKPRSTKMNFSVWSEPLPRETHKNTFKGFVYRYIFTHVDSLQNLWFGTYNIIKRKLPNAPLQMIPWGLASMYFNHKDECQTQEAKSFIASLPQEKTKFFWPKSISYASRHDLIIEAAMKLKAKGITDFVVYFWLGNAINEKIFDELLAKLKKSGVENLVKVVEHGFLPFEDIIQIWKNMDVGLQIASHDALSTSLLEPLFFKKEVIVTNIEPYQLLEKQFDLNLKLIDQNADELANRMEQLIIDSKTSNDELEKRHQIVATNFNFEKNVREQIKQAIEV